MTTLVASGRRRGPVWGSGCVLAGMIAKAPVRFGAYNNSGGSTAILHNLRYLLRNLWASLHLLMSTLLISLPRHKQLKPEEDG